MKARYWTSACHTRVQGASRGRREPCGRRARGRGKASFLVVLLFWSAAVVAQSCTPDTTVPHAPVRVVYGHLGGAEQATIIAPASDGSVRAIDAATTAPLWTFTPPEVATASAKSGLLTDLRVLRFDANGDGVVDVDAGDKVWLYFGLRRAGAAYYALDISDRTHVRLLWRVDATTLAGLADAWSTPTIARVRISGAKQNGEHFVLIFGGGYDTAGNGNRLFMIDAASGHLLWQMNMTSPIPAAVSVLDTDSDEYADRMYAVDVNGRIWRFDIWNGHPTATLVTGGVIADLRDPTLLASEVPQFFNAPDVALIQPRGGTPYYNIAVGSGNPLIPASTDTQDRFYSIRDRAPFDARSQTSYDSTPPILFADLVDVSSGTEQLSPDVPGWTLALGAQVAGSAVTVNGVVMFTTFQQTGVSSDCVVSGSTSIYAVRIDTAQAGVDLDGDGKVTSADVVQALPAVTDPAAVTIRLGGTRVTVGPGPDANHPPASALTPECIVGSTTLKTCVTANALVRTFWQRRGVK
jgi:type IV pilus assembly protein PilY1